MQRIERLSRIEKSIVSEAKREYNEIHKDFQESARGALDKKFLYFLH